MTIKDLSDVRGPVAILKWAKARKAEIKVAEDKARAEIEEAMGDADVGILDDEVVITWGSHKRNSFDQKAFAEAHPDLFELFKASSSVRRFALVDDGD